LSKLTTYIAVNFSILNETLEAKKIKEASSIDKEVLVKCGVIKNTNKLVKLLAKGELKTKFDFKLDAYSAAARVAVEKAGGKIL
jgi:large subunit ribosomal protein L15